MLWLLIRLFHLLGLLYSLHASHAMVSSIVLMCVVCPFILYFTLWLSAIEHTAVSPFFVVCPLISLASLCSMLLDGFYILVFRIRFLNSLHASDSLCKFFTTSVLLDISIFFV